MCDMCNALQTLHKSSLVVLWHAAEAHTILKPLPANLIYFTILNITGVAFALQAAVFVSCFVSNL